tara:strand:- start:10 stop:330 length:321 start_codon:yes stop_codon:yes gene_type:complete
MQWDLVLLIVVILECLVIMRGLVELNRSIVTGLEDLDASLAEAISAVVSRFTGGDSMEPVNPIQAALAQLLTSKIDRNIPGGSPRSIEVLARDPGGKFSSEKNNND